MSAARVVAVIPVRMGSSRLPGKTLMPISGQPLLGHLLDRLGLCYRLDDVVVATSKCPENDAIQAYCQDHSVVCFRGDEDDVLARLLGALEVQGADVGVVVFGDAPLIDPEIVDAIVGRFMDEGAYDFLSNDLTTTYPPGMEVEVFGVGALRDSAARASDAKIREHGTLFIRQNPNIYRICNVEAPAALRRPELEIEVDTEEDAHVISAIVDHFGTRKDYSLAEIIAFMDANPELTVLNQDVPRRWKQYRTDES